MIGDCLFFFFCGAALIVDSAIAAKRLNLGETLVMINISNRTNS